MGNHLGDIRLDRNLLASARQWYTAHSTLSMAGRFRGGQRKKSSGTSPIETR